VTEGTHLQLLQGNLVSRAVVAELDLFSHTSKVKKRGVAQLVARTAGGREAAGSSPVTPTMDLFLEIDEIKFLTDGGSRGQSWAGGVKCCDIHNGFRDCWAVWELPGVGLPIIISSQMSK
jgi:hypothetical protein